MTPDDLDTLAHSITLHSQLVQTNLRGAVGLLWRDLNEHDGYGHGHTYDGGPVTHSRQSPVERAVALRAGKNDNGPSAKAYELCDQLRTASDSLRRALDLMDHISSRSNRLDLTDSERKRLRCIGTGDSSGATCYQWGVIRGRCIDCHRAVEAERKRKERMRTETPA